MTKTPITLRENHNIGRETREWVLHRFQERALGANGIEAVGWLDAHEGYSVGRVAGAMDLIYVCLEGRGEVFIEGRWQACPPDTAFLSPSGQPQFYRTVPGVVWRACWLLGFLPGFVGVTQPKLVPAFGRSLQCAIEGLYHEVNDAADGESGKRSAVERWVEIIAGYGHHIGHAEGHRVARLRGVWQRVLADPDADWNIRALTEIASVSEESLRRICHAETGKAPMEHVTHLRMRCAASLLATNTYSVAAVSQKVGYNNAMAFSTAFRRVVGKSPSIYRREGFDREEASNSRQLR